MPGGIPEKYRDLFSKRAFASLGTLMPDGRPQVTPVWCGLGRGARAFQFSQGPAKGPQRTAGSTRRHGHR